MRMMPRWLAVVLWPTWSPRVLRWAKHLPASCPEFRRTQALVHAAGIAGAARPWPAESDLDPTAGWWPAEFGGRLRTQRFPYEV